ncbi:S41 family peptidase [Paenibacillus radicis (ex Gao et al. 2016)]|uniref:Carboxy-terminal processing protease CtpA n=1 Tax=Paenibacillus radicis (ex Gao et al. 2016) TaxID=1737354 RepID=A0A917HF56_9BACL|nr:S41 family peptidase [Paenibacillus radicis (ex Gao et al. 2016)]GGG76794.1 carboxy-terminal processing protease CtpA [Paenibacillus radicis (ex Gao et al. 2016)]
MKYFTNEVMKQRAIAIAVLGAVVFAAVGFGIGWLWMGYKYPMLREPSFRNFAVSYETIMDDYLNGAKAEDLINGASQGMVASLEDPYSRYLIKEQGNAYTQGYEGEFSGVGITVREEDGLFVVGALTKGAPAERGGIKLQDAIVAVNDEKMAGKKYEQLIGLMRGEEGTEVKLTLQRGNQLQPIEVKLIREAIPVHTVTSEMLEGGVGHITISRFAQKTGDEFETEVAKLQKQGMNKLLLDMRSNPGGLLQSTLQIADILVPKGKTVLQVVYKNDKRVITYKSKQEKPWNIPIAVLVNGQSASASEVLTAALKESAGATVIGEKTYGKGVVQAFQQFKDGSVLSLTEAQWKTPGGTWIHKAGVTPDVVVALPSYASLRPLPIGGDMKKGSYGEDVKTLQTMLNVLGYADTGQPGLFDAQTEQALRRFQNDQKLTASGAFNDKTAYRLLEELNKKLEQEDTQLKKGLDVLKK